MKYQDFAAYIQTFLWKDGDTVLRDNLPSLIRMANSDLTVVLQVQEMQNVAVVTAESDTIDLPTDYFKMRDVNLVGLGEAHYSTPAELYAMRPVQGLNNVQMIYSTQNDKLLLCGPITVEVPLDVQITYHTKLPDFYKDDDESWVPDTFMSLYTYAVLRHASAFLREDERVGQWSQMYAQAVEQTNSVDAFSRSRGKGKRHQLPRPASAARYGNWRNRL